jgi:hypothetical protein
MGGRHHCNSVRLDITAPLLGELWSRARSITKPLTDPAKIRVMPALSATVKSSAPTRSPILIVIAGWLIPGSGHFLLGRRNRAAIVSATVVIAFVVGVLMRGPMFQLSSTGDLLSRLIQYGGFIADIATGLLYFVSVWLGYAPPDQAGHAPDYGSKFIVAAGLMNILGVIDAYEIATGQKD